MVHIYQNNQIQEANQTPFRGVSREEKKTPTKTLVLLDLWQWFCSFVIKQVLLLYITSQ